MVGQKKADRLIARTGSGRAIEAVGVVAGIGIHPDLELAKKAGLEANNGVIVNELLQTSHPDIYTAGDTANFIHATLGKRVRVEHEDNAVQMGKLAGHKQGPARSILIY